MRVFILKYKMTYINMLAKDMDKVAGEEMIS
jgi:hypothetical protein